MTRLNRRVLWHSLKDGIDFPGSKFLLVHINVTLGFSVLKLAKWIVTSILLKPNTYLNKLNCHSSHLFQLILSCRLHSLRHYNSFCWRNVSTGWNPGDSSVSIAGRVFIMSWRCKFPIHTVV